MFIFVWQGMRVCIALHPYPEPPCLDAFLTPFVEELIRYGPLQPTEGEPSEMYHIRNGEARNGLRVDKVVYLLDDDGSVDRSQVRIDLARPKIILGPITCDSPMRARACQRTWTSSLLGAMCCMLQAS